MEAKSAKVKEVIPLSSNNKSILHYIFQTRVRIENDMYQNDLVLVGQNCPLLSTVADFPRMRELSQKKKYQWLNRMEQLSGHLVFFSKNWNCYKSVIVLFYWIENEGNIGSTL